MQRLMMAIAAALMLVLVLGGTAWATETVRATNSDSFQPATTHVSNGEKVVWKNVAGHDHTVTSTSSNWNKNTHLNPGDKTHFTFNHNGTYRFKCTIHQGMSGKIVVG